MEGQGGWEAQGLAARPRPPPPPTLSYFNADVVAVTDRCIGFCFHYIEEAYIDALKPALILMIKVHWRGSRWPCPTFYNEHNDKNGSYAWIPHLGGHSQFYKWFHRILLLNCYTYIRMYCIVLCKLLLWSWSSRRRNFPIRKSFAKKVFLCKNGLLQKPSNLCCKYKVPRSSEHGEKGATIFKDSLFNWKWAADPRKTFAH
jgi:hypothetical protein